MVFRCGESLEVSIWGLGSRISGFVSRVDWSSLLGPVDPSSRALAGRLKLTVRRHKFNKESLYLGFRVERHLVALSVRSGQGDEGSDDAPPLHLAQRRCIRERERDVVD